MEFVNESGFPAGLFTGFIGEDVIRAQLVVRATYRLTDDGSLEKSDEQWPIFNEPLQTKMGSFPIDLRRKQKGCDVVVTGVLRRPNPVREATLTLTVDQHRRELRVFGDRVWDEREGELFPSEPAPFSEMPIHWEKAYGGVVEFEGTQGAHPLNAVGKGFYLSMESAAGKPLPNIEDPKALISTWKDRPTPACWASVSNPLGWYTVETMLANPGVPPEELSDIVAERAVYSACKPEMVLPDVTRASKLTLSGFGESEVTLDLSGVIEPQMQASFGADQMTADCKLGGVWLFLEERLLVVTLSATVHGSYRPHESRNARVFLVGASPS